jgi:protein O-mannosyl-transferase
MDKTVQKNGVLSLLLLALVALLYGQFLWNPILFDDLPFFMVDMDGKLPVKNFHLELFQLRSLPYATLAWTNNWLGLDLNHFRMGNLLLHGMTAIVLFFFLQSLFLIHLEDEKRERSSQGLSPQAAAFFAVLLFAVHPIATYAVGYLVQRTIVMATLFSLLSLWAYVHGSARQSSIGLWLSVLCYVVAVFSKEHAIMLPAVLVALTVLQHRDWRVKLKERWPIFAALAAVGVIVLLAIKGVLGSVYEIHAAEMLTPAEQAKAYPLSILTQTWLFFKYALLWVMPHSGWMSIDMREPFARSLFSAYLLAASAFLAWGVGACWLLVQRGRAGLAGFGLLFPWLMFFTEFSSVRLQEIFVLYRSYLWVVGAFCLLPVVFAKVNGRTAGAILSAVALAMVPISMERLMVLSQPLFAWDDAEKLVKGRDDLPGAYRIYYNRGNEERELGMIGKAQADYKQAIALNPEFAAAFGNLAGTYASQNDWKTAIDYYQIAIAMDEKKGKLFASAYGNIGVAYSKVEDWPHAVAAFNQALEVFRSAGRPLNGHYLVGRAGAYEKLGEIPASQADYRLACDLAQMGCDKLR